MHTHAGRLLTSTIRACRALVVVWMVDVAYRFQLEAAPEGTDWAFIADCVIDVVAKILYTSVIRERECRWTRTPSLPSCTR